MVTAVQSGSAGTRSRTTRSLVTTRSEPRRRAARGTNSRMETATPMRIENSTLMKTEEKAVISTRPAS